MSASPDGIPPMVWYVEDLSNRQQWQLSFLKIRIQTWFLEKVTALECTGSVSHCHNTKHPIPVNNLEWKHTHTYNKENHQKASKITVYNLSSLDCLYAQCTIKHTTKIIKDALHQAHHLFQLLSSWRSLDGSAENRSFFPYAIQKLYFTHQPPHCLKDMDYCHFVLWL